MVMDPGSDDEDDTVDIVRLTDKSQGQKRFTQVQALEEQTLVLLVCSLMEFPQITE